MEKDESIRSVVAKMLAVYGQAVRVTDYWPDDPMAVGIERTDMPALLVYIAALPDGKLYLSFECPPGPEERAAELPYRPAGEMTCASLDDAIVAAGKHLQVERSA